MIGDNVYNREQLDMHEFCHKFWTTDVADVAKVQKKKLDDEERKILAEEKKHEEEEAELRRKLADLAAKKQKKADEEAQQKQKLADAIVKNNTSLKVSANWNAMQKTNLSTEEKLDAAVSSNHSTPIATKTLTYAYDTSVAKALLSS